MRALTLLSIVSLLVAASGCDDNGGTDAGTDAGPPTDSGTPMVCPTTQTPAPEELMGPCCYRTEQSGQLGAPEMRVTYLELVEPEGSPLSSMTLGRVLNESLQEEGFNLLFRVEDADADGDINLVVGYGVRNADGTYSYSQGAGSGDPDSWCAVEIPGTLAGETVNTEPLDGDLTVPIFNEEMTMVQLELRLRALQIIDATWTENRSCIGAKAARPFTYQTTAQLGAFIEVEPSRTQMIEVPPVVTTVCAAIAGSLDNGSYCEDNDQADWLIQPDSMCDATGCTRNTEGMTDVCDPATTCNAWYIIGGFAAAGVDINNGACGS